MNTKLCFLTLALLLSSCSAPHFDGATLAGKAAILDNVNLLLSKGDCTGAVKGIEDLYSSVNTDNDVRMIRASAHACRAGLSSYFSFTGKLADPATNPIASVPTEGAYFWRTMAKLFYAETTSGGSAVVDTNELNTRLQAAWNATDALLAALIVPPSAVALSNKINSGTNNVGSANASDRTVDSNLYLMYVAMANIGILEDLYGYNASAPPDQSTFKKKKKLGSTALKPNGWETAADVDTYGCSYASGILNLKDAIGVVSANLSSGGLKTALTNISTILNNFDATCTAACTVCGFTCTECPRNLRNRDSCKVDATTSDDDIARCAAAGMVTLIDTDTTVGWVGP